MKTKHLILIGLFLGACTCMNAQAYKTAIGVKGGNAYLGTFKHFLSEKLAVEAVAGFGATANADLYAAVYAQLHFPIGSVDNLTWFAGAGPNLATYGVIGNSGSSFGITGIGGADYSFDSIPLNVSADVSTPVFFGDSVLNFVPYVTVSARYILGGGGDN